MLSRLPRAFIVSAVLLAGVAPVAAQEPLQKVKDLYSSAAYEDTLAAIKGLAPTESKPEIEQYRIFSLVALGRLDEAEQVIEALLVEHPRYRPEPGDASPRIMALFTKVRSRVGPDAVKSLYKDARAALDQKDRERAISLFEQMLQTADDPDIKDAPSVAELRLLGAGFLDLSRALPATPAAAPVAGKGTPASDAAPAGPAAVGTVGTTDAVAVTETFPPWLPPNDYDRREFVGVLRVHISDKGTVVKSEIVKSVHPAYDGLLLKASKDWVYQPARLNGAAVASTKDVQVRLKPPHTH